MSTPQERLAQSLTVLKKLQDKGIPLPSVDEQSKIILRVEKLEKEIDQIEKELAAVEKEKEQI